MQLMLRTKKTERDVFFGRLLFHSGTVILAKRIFILALCALSLLVTVMKYIYTLYIYTLVRVLQENELPFREIVREDIEI